MTDLLTLCRQRGSDKQFREWVQKQPSCLDKAWSEYLESGEGRSIACHVRRSANAGVAIKPEYSAVPMTFNQHNEQSWFGEAGCLNRFRPERYWTNADAKEFFEAQVVKYRRLWVES